MANLNNITVNISLNGEIDVERLAEEFKASIRKEIERVGVSVEAVPYRKVTDRKPKAGDFVKFSEEYCEGDTDLSSDKYYEISSIDHHTHISFFDDESDDRYKSLNEDGMEIYEKVSPCCEETVTDVIICNGKKYHNLGPVNAEKGDFVRFHSNYKDTKAGVLYEVVGGDIYKDSEGSTKYYTSGWGGTKQRDVFRLVEAEPNPEPLKIGEYAKTLVDSKYGTTKKGEVVKIENVGYPVGSGHTVCIRNMRGKDGLYKPEHLTHATDEEVAEAKRKLEEVVEAEKWAKIGRKPNEFKKGDIVCVREDEVNGSYHRKGDIGEITTDACREEFRVKTGRNDSVNWVRPLDVELVTPVEARFDLTVEDRA